MPSIYELNRTEESKERHREANRKWHSDPENRARRSAAARRRRAEQPEKQREIQRRYDLKRNYGMEPAGYEALLHKQNYECAVCGSQHSGRHDNENLPVDHDHETGAVRGLLCNKCNTGIGLLADNPDRLLKAADYLLKHNLKNHSYLGQTEVSA